MGDSRGRSAHRLRQRRQPAARARRRTPARDGGAPGPRRRPRRRLVQQLLVESLLLGARRGPGRARHGRWRRAARAELLRDPETPNAGVDAARLAHPRVHVRGLDRSPACCSGWRRRCSDTRPDARADAEGPRRGSVVGHGRAAAQGRWWPRRWPVAAAARRRRVSSSARCDNLLAVDDRVRPARSVAFDVDPSLNGYIPATRPSSSPRSLLRAAGLGCLV